MKQRSIASSPIGIGIISGALFLTSCTVDESAGLFSKPSAAAVGENKKTKKVTSSTKTKEQKPEEADWITKWREAEEKRKAAAEKRAAELKEEKAKKLAEQKKQDEIRQKIKEREATEEAARKVELAKQREEEARERRIAYEKRKLAEETRRKQLETRRKAELEARKIAEERRKARELAEASAAGRGASSSSPRFGLVSFFGGNSSNSRNKKPENIYYSEGHYIYVNQMLLSSLDPSNSKVEIDLSDQRVRIFKNDGNRALVIESQISTGKSGHVTPTGTYRIQEKLVEKKSGRYGTWLNSSGQTIPSEGDSRKRPRGASQFVGADMPYWMRITGGIGMHIGHVPNYPASHGCIRVPRAIQPLIFSKVGVGTSVTIRY